MVIPLRMAQFLGVMLIHGDGRGKVIVPLVLFTIAANGGLNWLYIYQLGFGFSGCYFATIVSTAIELSIILLLINYPGMWRSLLHSLHQFFTSMRDVMTVGLLATSVFALLLLVVDDHFWHRLYGVSAAASGWWYPFLIVLAVTMPLNLVNSYQRGSWQARERYTFIFAVVFCVQWLIFLPCIFIGIYLGNAWLTLAGWIFGKIATGFVYFIKRRDLVTGRDFGFVNDTTVIAQSSSAGGG